MTGHQLCLQQSPDSIHASPPSVMLSHSLPLRSRFADPLWATTLSPSEVAPSFPAAASELAAVANSLALKLPFRIRDIGDLLGRKHQEGLERDPSPCVLSPSAGTHAHTHD